MENLLWLRVQKGRRNTAAALKGRGVLRPGSIRGWWDAWRCLAAKKEIFCFLLLLYHRKEESGDKIWLFCRKKAEFCRILSSAAADRRRGPGRGPKPGWILTNRPKTAIFIPSKCDEGECVLRPPLQRAGFGASRQGRAARCHSGAGAVKGGQPVSRSRVCPTLPGRQEARRQS